jgi:hypothetical protein
MSDDILRTVIWVGLAAAIVAVFMVLELVFRALTNRFGTPQEGRFPHRVGSQLPRVER